MLTPHLGMSCLSLPFPLLLAVLVRIVAMKMIPQGLDVGKPTEEPEDWFTADRGESAAHVEAKRKAIK